MQKNEPDVFVITIDGPTASGKGTVAQRVAQALHFHYLDSGALYRLVALSALRSGTALEDEEGVSRIAMSLPCRFEGGKIWLGDEDATDLIREEAIGIGASRVGALPAVRSALVDLQRSFRRAPGLVTDGRDMGSVIFPDARLKVYLTAEVGERAKRRYKQLIEKGFSANIDSLSRDLEARDLRDRERSVAPLASPEGAYVLDTTHLDIEESVGQVLQWYQSKTAERT